MSKRIYFLTSEIVPFAESYILAPYSKEVPNVFIEDGVDFRVMMPKYGFISERRYILREVIRLRDMKLNFQGQEVDASVKSAFVPNTKVQVYFLENEEYYKPTDKNNLYSPAEENYRNSIRFSYFSSAALATLNYLRWKPDVIICNDWQMALLPVLLEAELLDNEYFEDVKIVQTLLSKSEKSKYSLDEYDTVGMKEVAESLTEGKELDAVAASLQLADKVLFVNHNQDLQEEYEQDGFEDIIKENENKIHNFNLENTNQDDWEKLANEIDGILENL